MSAQAPESTLSGLPGRVSVVENAAALAAAAFDRFVEAVRSAPGPHVAVCLSGGSTPKQLYEHIARSGGDLPWPRLHWFLGDERLVPPDSPDSNLGMVREAMLAHAPPTHVHPVPTVGTTPQDAAAAYERELKAFYGADTLERGRPLFDLMILGIGPDGHTASLFPGTPEAEETRAWVVGVSQAGQPPHVPRVSLTVPALSSARIAMVLAAGHSKHAILSRIAEGEDLPAGRVARLAGAEWLLDRAATGPSS